MYLLREGSKSTEDPMFMRIPEDPRLLFFPERATAQWFYDAGLPEKPLIEWTAENLVQPDKVFVDIGAHVGTYAWTCGRRAAHTYAFECNPQVFCYLAANIALQGLEERITPLPFALGRSEGVMDYIVRSADGGGNGLKAFNAADEAYRRLPVQVRTLDSFGLQNVGCIKIDVEGAEKEVLEGATETIRRCRPKILYESWGDWKTDVPAAALRTEVQEYLRSLGYRVMPVSGATDMYLAEPV